MNITSIAAGTIGFLKYFGKKYIAGNIGIKITARIFCDNASFTSPWSSACIARRVPQPGQWIFVRAFVGQGGKMAEVDGSKKQSKASTAIAPMPKSI